MKMYVDGVAAEATDGKGIKEVLTGMGYAFPCGGRGICGRCRGIAAGIAPTALDEKFLSSAEIAAGIRLLCDKEGFDGAEIVPLFGKSSADLKISECDAYVLLGKESIEIGIVAGETRLFKVFAKPEKADKKILRSICANGLLEYLEEFSIAKATTVAVFGERKAVETLVSGACDVGEGDTFPAAEVDLPAEDCFVAPCGDGSSTEKLVPLKREGETDGETIARVLGDVRLRNRL